MIPKPPDTPRNPGLPSPAVEAPRNGGAYDPRAEADREAYQRAEQAIPRGRSPEEYARMSAVFSYKAAEAADASAHWTGELLGRIKGLEQRVESALLQQARVDAPPPRPRAESISSLDEETTLNGTPTQRWVGTHEQLEAIADARAEAKFAALRRQAEIESAAAPLLFIRGAVPDVIKGAGVVVLAAIVLGLWTLLSPHFR